MGKELKEYIISKKHHQYRRDFPENQKLAEEYAARRAAGEK